MSSINDYKSRMSRETSKRESNISHTKRMIEQSFIDSPSYQEVYINDNGTVTGVWIVDNSETKDTKNIISLVDNPITAGDIIKWNSAKWLITIKEDISLVNHKGNMSKCIADLKWVDSYGMIRTTPFTFEGNTSTNFGIQDGRVMVMDNERRTILVQNNEYTKKIEKDKRFIIDGRAWRVSAVDRLSKSGIVQLGLEADQIGALDNLELGIADYVSNLVVEILNGTNMTIQAGSTRQLSVEARNGVDIIDLPLVYESSNEAIATIDENGLITSIANGTTTITAKLKDAPSVSDAITLTVQLASDDNYTVEIVGSDTITKGYSQHYTIEVMNNGVADNTKSVQWYVFGDDGISSTALATLSNKQNTQCDVNGVNTGYVKLKCVMVGTSSITDTKRIQIKSLI